MTKETLLELTDDLSIEELDSLIQTLYTIKPARLAEMPNEEWNEAELEALFTSEP